MKQFISENISVVFVFLIGVILSSVSVYGATLLTTNEVMYTDTKTTKTAIDELYTKVNNMYTKAQYDANYTTGYNAGKAAAVHNLYLELGVGNSHYEEADVEVYVDGKYVLGLSVDNDDHCHASSSKTYILR